MWGDLQKWWRLQAGWQTVRLGRKEGLEIRTEDVLGRKMWVGGQTDWKTSGLAGILKRMANNNYLKSAHQNCKKMEEGVKESRGKSNTYTSEAMIETRRHAINKRWPTGWIISKGGEGVKVPPFQYFESMKEWYITARTFWNINFSLSSVLTQRCVERSERRTGVGVEGWRWVWFVRVSRIAGADLQSEHLLNCSSIEY